jgi:hypothetical protein
VDSPYIEDILQKYGSYVSRIGTLQINQSPFKLQEEMAELRKEKSKEKKKTQAKKTAIIKVSKTQVLPIDAGKITEGKMVKIKPNAQKAVNKK